MLLVTDVSKQAFTVLSQQRVDRSSTARAWGNDAPISAEVRASLTQAQDAELPALRAMLAGLAPLDFPAKPSALPTLQHALATLTTLQAAFWDGVAKPRSQRRAALATDYVAEGVALEAALGAVSASLTEQIRNEDNFVDQMMLIKQLAWQTRGLGGDASSIVTFGLAAGRLAADKRVAYAAAVGGTKALWLQLQDIAAATPMPAALRTGIADAGARFFAADYMAKRESLLDALTTGGKPDMTDDQFAAWSVTHLNAMTEIADAALTAAGARALASRGAAWQRLALDGGLLLAALALTGLGMLAVTRRVIRPLQVLRDAMLRIAGGDLTAAAPFTERHDEIGALAGALAIFQRQAQDKLAIEADQHRQQESLQTRQATVGAHIAGFQREVQHALEALGGASTQMSQVSDEMGAIADRNTSQVQTAEAAAGDASTNVATIAAATEQLSA